MKRRTFIVAAAGAVGTASAWSNPNLTAPAGQAAGRWLGVVDSADYQASWQQAGQLFRTAVTAERWAQDVRAVREPLGALRDRRLDKATVHETLPGVPDGQYVVLQYASAFAHKAAAVETLTTVLEPDGAWRVVGYFVR